MVLLYWEQDILYFQTIEYCWMKWKTRSIKNTTAECFDKENKTNIIDLANLRQNELKFNYHKTFIQRQFIYGTKTPVDISRISGRYPDGIDYLCLHSCSHSKLFFLKQFQSKYFNILSFNCYSAEILDIKHIHTYDKFLTFSLTPSGPSSLTRICYH